MGFHDPKNYPKNPDVLLKKAEAPKPMSPQALRAMLKAAGFNPPTPAVPAVALPTPEEVEQYGRR